MKKYLSIILAILLVMSALTGCAGKNNPTKQDNALNTTATDPETAPVSESSNSPSVSNTSAAYEKLIAYKTDNYSQQSVADFNNLLLDNNDFLELLEAHSDVMAAISPNDDNYDFIMLTLNASLNEIYYEQVEKNTVFSLSGYLEKKEQPMREVLERANFELLVLVGDTYQIESIEFGNWFDAVRFFLPQTAVCELTTPYRSESGALLNVWNDVRKMNGDIYYLLQTYGYSTDLDKSIFAPAREGEVVLCLNYGGLYGINNINHFLQESNTGKAIWRGIQRYKVGDPIFWFISRLIMVSPFTAMVSFLSETK